MKSKEFSQMLHQLSPPFHLLLHLNFTIIIFILPVSVSAIDEQYKGCSHSFQCGNIKNISYPFWGYPQPPYCGPPEFELMCQDGFPVIQIMSESFRVLNMNYNNHIIRLARLVYTTMLVLRGSSTPPSAYLFSYTPHYGNLTLLHNCSSVSPALASNKFSCRKIDSSRENGYFTIGSIPSDGNLGRCNVSVTVPVLQTAEKALMDNSSSLTNVLNEGFEVQWIIDDTACSECIGSGGSCGYNTTYFQPICFCPGKPYLMRCPTPSGSELNIEKAMLIAALVFGACSVAVIVIICFLRRKSTSNKSIIFWMKRTRNAQNVEAFLEKCGSFAPKRYSYSDVKKITSSFKNKLGQGGYGDVCERNLPDGRLVAVKVLSESKITSVKTMTNRYKIEFSTCPNK